MTESQAAQAAQAWQERFGAFTKENLATRMVLDVGGQPYVFVHKDHPAITLLEANAEMIGMDITENPLHENEFYKVSRQVLEACCNTLIHHVLEPLEAAEPEPPIVI